MHQGLWGPPQYSFFWVVNAFSQQRRQRPTTKVTQVTVLSKALQHLYRTGGAQAIVNNASDLQSMSVDVLVQAATYSRDRGVASGILNGILGSYCLNEGDGTKAVALMKEYDALSNDGDETSSLKPDLVALVLAHVATKRSCHTQEACLFLQRAQQLSTRRKVEPPPVAVITPQQQKQQLESHGIHVLHETADLVVVSKPSGMVCYHGATFATKDNRKSTIKKKRRKKPQDLSLEDCLRQSGVDLRATLNESSTSQEGRGGFVSRLDKGTSGCMVIAKNDEMHAFLMVQYFLRATVHKSYQALVDNGGAAHILQKDGTVDLPIDGRPAQSDYHVVAEHALSTTKSQSWTHLHITTKQGRRHQVRIHCARGLGAPILLDPLYGNEGAKKGKNRFCLHADRLSIPSCGIDVQAKIPDWWEALKQELE